MNFLNYYKNIFFKILSLLLLFSIYIVISASYYANAISYDISNSVFRLHVIANSDSEEDQNLKFLIRDALISYMKSLTSNISTKSEAIKLANANIDEFYDIANKIVLDNGYNYPIHISIEQCNFPTKSYGDISLPSGKYDALRVEIGKAAGHNWWCVMFPPLCFIDVSSGILPDNSKEQLENTMSEESYELITQPTTKADLEVKFKIIELFENAKLNLAKH